MKLLKQREGFTFIEVLISLIIVSVIFLLLYSLYSFAIDYFNRGESKSSLQSDVRNMASFITKEVRNAVELELLGEDEKDKISDFISNKDNYIILEEGSIKHINYQGQKTKTHNYIKKLEFSLEKSNKDMYILNFLINAKQNKEEYQLDSKVLLNNLTGREEELEVKSIIYYKKP